MAVLAGLRRWLYRKQYHFEVTFGVYMHTAWEKFAICASAPPPSSLERGALTTGRLGPLPPLRPGLHRRHPLPAAPRRHPRRPRLVLHQGRGH